MDKSTVLRIISGHGKALEAEGVKPQKIILFGSCCTGTQHEGSDIDLVVISEDFAGRDYWERIDVLAAALVRVFEPIEAIAMTPQEWESGDSRIVDFARMGKSSTAESFLMAAPFAWQVRIKPPPPKSHVPTVAAISSVSLASTRFDR